MENVSPYIISGHRELFNPLHTAWGTLYGVLLLLKHVCGSSARLSFCHARQLSHELFLPVPMTFDVLIASYLLQQTQSFGPFQLFAC